jgi:hypothetical protein
MHRRHSSHNKEDRGPAAPLSLDNLPDTDVLQHLLTFLGLGDAVQLFQVSQGCRRAFLPLLKSLRLASRRRDAFPALIRLLQQLEGLERLEILFLLACDAALLVDAIGDGSLKLAQLQALQLPDLRGPHLAAALIVHLADRRLPRLVELKTDLRNDVEALCDALEERGRLGLPPLRRVGSVGYADVATLQRLWALLPPDRVTALEATDGARVAALGKHLLSAAAASRRCAVSISRARASGR